MTRSTFTKSILGTLAGLALGTSAQAAQITGTLSYISATMPNNSDLTQATAFTFAGIGFVVSATGDLTGVGTSVTTAAGLSGLPLGLGNAPATVPVSSLWSGNGFVFDLTTLNIDFRSATQFNASGKGTITAPGFDPTPGTWTFVVTGSGPVLGFAAGSEAKPTPDAGATMTLLGLGLVGLGLVRRK
jgi:hypothetical protein